MEQSMAGLMDDDVVRETRVDGLAGHVHSPGVATGGEVAEQKRVAVGIVKCILAAKRMRQDQERDTDGDAVAFSSLFEIQAPSEGALERLDRLHHERVRHLLMEARVGLRRLESALNQNPWVFE